MNSSIIHHHIQLPSTLRRCRIIKWTNLPWKRKSANLILMEVTIGERTWRVIKKMSKFFKLLRHLMFNQMKSSIHQLAPANRNERDSRQLLNIHTCVHMVLSHPTTSHIDEIEMILNRLLKMDFPSNEILNFFDITPLTFIPRQYQYHRLWKEGLVLKRYGLCKHFNRCHHISHYHKKWLIITDDFIAYTHPVKYHLQMIMFFDQSFRADELSDNNSNSTTFSIISNGQQKIFFKTFNLYEKQEWLQFLRQNVYYKSVNSHSFNYTKWPCERPTPTVNINTIKITNEIHNHLNGSTAFYDIQSFVPKRENIRCKWLVDGNEYMKQLAIAFELAEREIFIGGWFLSPQIFLQRPAIHGNYNRLDEILKRRAKESNVKIYILIYKEVDVMFDINSIQTKQLLEMLHENIRVIRMPDHVSTNAVLFWAAHEKIVVIDQKIAFIGGIDLAFGRWDTKQHTLVDVGSVTTHNSLGNNIDERCRLFYSERALTDDKRCQTMNNSNVAKQFCNYLSETFKKNLSTLHETTTTTTTTTPQKSKTLSLSISSFNLADKFRKHSQDSYQMLKNHDSNDGLLEVPLQQTSLSSTVTLNGMGDGGGLMENITNNSEIHSSPIPSRSDSSRNYTFRFSSNELNPNDIPHMKQKVIKEESSSEGNWQYLRTMIGDAKMFLGKDYFNTYKSKLKNFDKPFVDELDRTRQARTPWHDIATMVIGEVAKDCAKHFIQRWNYAVHLKTNGKYKYKLSKRYKLLWPNGKDDTFVNHSANQQTSNSHRLSSSNNNSFNIDMDNDDLNIPFQSPHRLTTTSINSNILMNWNISKEEESKRKQNSLLYRELLDDTSLCENVLLLRSVSQWQCGVKYPERSILNAYYQTIRESKRCLYIENQFFITSITKDMNDIENRIGSYIVDRIIEARMKNESFYVYIILPLIPGFKGFYGDKTSVGIHLLTDYTLRTISQGPTSIAGQLTKHDIDFRQHFIVCGMRTWDTLLGRPITEAIYVHSKLMIADNNIAIIGSANINDRSMLGSRDSEIAVIIENERYTSSLIQRLLTEHLNYHCSLENIMNTNILGQKETFDLFREISDKNERIYNDIFSTIPNNQIKNFKNLNEYLKKNEELTMEHNDAIKLLKENIRGYLVTFPLYFMKEQKLMDGIFNKQMMLPNYVWL
ncbi:hypothetical protein SNEBB_005119 [Seison nebaliae]|nr:hypothetical protein SNEBB_005119 [Seison nebaliae]